MALQPTFSQHGIEPTEPSRWGTKVAWGTAGIHQAKGEFLKIIHGEILSKVNLSTNHSRSSFDDKYVRGFHQQELGLWSAGICGEKTKITGIVFLQLTEIAQLTNDLTNDGGFTS